MIRSNPVQWENMEFFRRSVTGSTVILSRKRLMTNLGKRVVFQKKKRECEMVLRTTIPNWE